MPFCRNCGKELSDGDLFCSGCGTSTGIGNDAETEAAFDVRTESDDDALMDAYISGTTGTPVRTHAYEHYKNAYSAMDRNNGSFTMKWNWAAFFFTGWHLMYRKAYLEGILLLVLFTIIPAGFNLILQIAAGLCINYILYRRYKTKLGECKAETDNSASRLSRMAAEGGTSTVVKVLAAIYFIAYIGIILFILLGSAALSAIPNVYYYY